MLQETIENHNKNVLVSNDAERYKSKSKNQYEFIR